MSTLVSLNALTEEASSRAVMTSTEKGLHIYTFDSRTNQEVEVTIPKEDLGDLLKLIDEMIGEF